MSVIPVMSDANAMLIASKVADTRADLLNAGANNTTSILQDANTNATTLLQEGCAQTASVVAAIDRAEQHTGAQAERIGYANASNVERNFAETRGLLQGNFTAALLAAKDNEIATHKSAGSIKEQNSDQHGRIIHEIGKSRDDLYAQAANYALSQAQSLGSNFAAIQLESAKNFAAVQAKMAECCCEIKESVITTANTTQQLIQTNENARIRDALAAANQENMVLRLRFPPPPPLAP